MSRLAAGLCQPFNTLSIRSPTQRIIGTGIELPISVDPATTLVQRTVF